MDELQACGDLQVSVEGFATSSGFQAAERGLFAGNVNWHCNEWNS